MKALRLLVVGVFVVGMVAGGRAEEKKEAGNADKILGSWEAVKSDGEGAPPVGTVVEFAKGGKLKVTHKQDGKDVTAEGTYKVDGDTLNITITHDGKEQTIKITIKKL